MISFMLDVGPENVKRRSRDVKGLSPLPQIAPEFSEEKQEGEPKGHSPAIVVSAEKPKHMLEPTAPLKLHQWSDFQRLAHEELDKSKATWQDTIVSIEDLNGTLDRIAC